MRHFLGAAIAALFFCSSCASGPSPENPSLACSITCPFGFRDRPRHLCNGDRRQFEDIRITGGEDVHGDPDRSRWFTGAPSWLAQEEAQRRLAERGVANTGDVVWARQYSATLQKVMKEYGKAGRAAYPKIDVARGTCNSVIRDIVAALEPGKRGQHPGEDELGQPTGKAPR
jgi:hypothetical protein